MALAKLDVIEQYFDDEGNPLPGGLIYTYVAETSTPLATYSNNDSPPSAHTNPIELDSAGRPPGDGIWFTQGASYKVIIKDADGVTLETIDKLTILVTDAETTAVQDSSAVLTYAGGPPTSSEWLGGERFDHDVDFLAGWAGSFGKVPKTLPTASFAVDIQKNNVTVGTATCTTLGDWIFATTGGAAVSFATGDELDFYGPSVVDATMANFGLTLAGTRV
jgi:hypothetical protein